MRHTRLSSAVGHCRHAAPHRASSTALKHRAQPALACMDQRYARCATRLKGRARCERHSRRMVDGPKSCPNRSSHGTAARRRRSPNCLAPQLGGLPWLVAEGSPAEFHRQQTGPRHLEASLNGQNQSFQKPSGLRPANGGAACCSCPLGPRLGISELSRTRQAAPANWLRAKLWHNKTWLEQSQDAHAMRCQQQQSAAGHAGRREHRAAGR